MNKEKTGQISIGNMESSGNTVIKGSGNTVQNFNLPPKDDRESKGHRRFNTKIAICALLFTAIIALYPVARDFGWITPDLRNVARFEPQLPGRKDTPSPPKFDDDTTRKAQQMLSDKAKGKTVSDNNIRWSKAIVAHNQSDWTEALPLWQDILRDNPDNRKALVSAIVAANALANAKPAGPEKTTLLDIVITYSKNLFEMPKAESEERAGAASNLIYAYSQTDNLDEARKIYEAMGSLGDSETIKESRTTAGCILIDAYCKIGKPDTVWQIYDDMRELGDSEIIKELRAQAASNLIDAYRKTGKLDTARQIYDGMRELGDSEIIKELRAQAGFLLICEYICGYSASRFANSRTINTKNISEARAIFEVMPNSDSESVQKWRAMSAVELVATYLVAAKNLPAAREIFHFMPVLGNSEVIKYRKRAADYIKKFEQTGHLEVLDSTE
ncbi:MAG: hypothetical protein LBH14_00740 [Desulfobulbaceae bacterium]|jgi:pentatricopeptide repeat protein|nr:hypothetical protein [Desulfobulbaceae bacterium]